MWWVFIIIVRCISTIYGCRFIVFFLKVPSEFRFNWICFVYEFIGSKFYTLKEIKYIFGLNVLGHSSYFGDVVRAWWRHQEAPASRVT